MPKLSYDRNQTNKFIKLYKYQSINITLFYNQSSNSIFSITFAAFSPDLFLFIRVFRKCSLSSIGRVLIEIYRSLIDLNLETNSSTVYLPTPGMHFIICPKIQFMGTLDLLFKELKSERLQSVVISSDC